MTWDDIRKMRKPRLEAALAVLERYRTQREFRLAVAREASLWSRRLQAMIKQPRAFDDRKIFRGD